MDQTERVDSESEARDQALHRARKLRSFYTHALIYALANSGLILINLLTGDGWWFYWPLFGWGVGLGFHALTVFGQFGPFSSDWEERKAEAILRRERDCDVH